MSENHLNIVSFNVPFPADYGGVIDVLYKIKALHSQGIKIILHCFQYGRPEQSALEQYCEEVFYYPRKTSILSHLSIWPYIIYSRRNKELLNNLRSNEYPILLEGLHAAYYLISKKLNNKKVLLRSHNIEHDYYRYLAKREKNVIRKWYYYKEAYLLKKTLNKIPSDTGIGAISKGDTEELKKRFPNTFWLPPFHSNNTLENIAGRGDYALYHGNLSVSENVEVAEHLIRQFSNKKVNLIVAGKNPADTLSRLIQEAENIRIIANPDDQTMCDLIKNAHVVLLPTFQTTGVKLKLLESLYKGRFCVANSAMTKGTMLENLVVTTENDFYNETVRLMAEDFSQESIKERAAVLRKYYNNQENARLIVNKIIKP